MIAVTFAISFAGSILALALRPVLGLAVYAIVLFCYPQPLTIPLGTIDFSTSRVVILPLLASALFRSRLHQKLKWNVMDTFAISYFLATIISYTFNAPILKVLERQGGMIFDGLLPYFAVRLIINSRENLITFIKTMVLIGVPLAILGASYSVTGYDPLAFMKQYYAFGLAEMDMGPGVMRKGFYRASVTFDHYIVFGLFFSGLFPLCLSLWNQRIWSKSAIFCCSCLMFVGALTSLSSGPLFSIQVTAMMLLCYKIRRLWPVFLIVFLSLTLFVEIFSNRHFYEVLTRFAFSGDSAHYRIGLIEETFGGGMTGHWFFGYGYVGIGPGNDNANFHWHYMDLVNIYIRFLVQTGLFALTPFLALNFMIYRRIVQAARISVDPRNSWLLYCIGALFVGWNVALMTVSPLGQFTNIFYMMVGVACNLPQIVLLSQHSPSYATAPRLSPLQLRYARATQRQSHA